MIIAKRENYPFKAYKYIIPNKYKYFKYKLLGKLSHFVSKNAANIDGLSEQTLEKLIELGWLNSFKDIYRLSEHKDEMSKLDGFGKRSVEKLLDAIEKSRSITLDRFIYALCIPLIGRSASKDIANYFNIYTLNQQHRTKCMS